MEQQYKKRPDPVSGMNLSKSQMKGYWNLRDYTYVEVKNFVEIPRKKESHFLYYG